jgi:ankyrin repeat protein
MNVTYRCNGHLIKQLIDAKANVGLKNVAGDTALHLTYQLGHLMDYGGTCPMWLNSQLNLFAPCTSKLLDAKANLWMENSHGDAAMKIGLLNIHRRGMHEGQLAYLRLMVEHGTDQSTGMTALMFAAAHGYTDVVRKLIEFGADTTVIDKNGSSALMMASNEDCMQLLKGNTNQVD